jgi:oligoribonuclease (3'-5' exoribonuclease)
VKKHLEKMTIYLDMEITGLSMPRDEILEIGTLDDQNRT